MIMSERTITNPKTIVTTSESIVVDCVLLLALIAPALPKVFEQARYFFKDIMEHKYRLAMTVGEVNIKFEPFSATEI